jgi:hypothetical protein
LNVQWKDCKIVTVISPLHQGSKFSSCNRTFQGRTGWQLTNDLDSLEQYGKRSIIRISGIPEPVGEVDTTETVRNLISESDPEYKPTDVIRSHRVGKISLEH